MGSGRADFSGYRGLTMVVCLLGVLSLTCAARLSVERQKLEVQKHLNRLNKPAVKSIEVYISQKLVWLLRKFGGLGEFLFFVVKRLKIFGSSSQPASGFISGLFV